jgi:hypothetical protein
VGQALLDHRPLLDGRQQAQPPAAAGAGRLAYRIRRLSDG